MLRSTWLALIALALFGCKNHDDKAPPASGGDGYTASAGGGSKRDGGQKPGADEDGGEENPDAGGKPKVNECDNVKAMAFVPEDLQPGMFVNSISAPADLGVTRVKLTWEADCTNPVFRLELSDGECPNGSGHALVFRFPIRGIESGSIRAGQNTISPTTGGGEATVDGIDIRYVRPTRLSPSGTWGTCAGANGTVDIVGELSPNLFGTLQGRFDLELTDCTDKNLPLQAVMGTFSGTFRRILNNVCPNRR